MSNPKPAAQPSLSSSLPLHIQISEMLTREIQAGILIEGERLPPERQLAARLGIAVGTLRKALADLESKGMLQRIQGSGNYVNNNPDVDNVYALFRLELNSGGGLPTADLLSVDKLLKPDDLPVFGQSESGHRFRRLRKLNDITVALEEIWLDGSYTDSVDQHAVSDSIYLYYKEALGFWISKIEDHVSVAALPKWSPSVFSESSVNAMGFIQRYSTDQHGNRAEFSRTWFDPTVAHFTAR